MGYLVGLADVLAQWDELNDVLFVEKRKEDKEPLVFVRVAQCEQHSPKAM